VKVMMIDPASCSDLVKTFWRDCTCNNPDFLQFFSWYLFQDPQFILLSIFIMNTKSQPRSDTSYNNPDFLYLFLQYIENFQVIFFFIYRFHQNFYQIFGRVSPILGGLKLLTKSYYISNFISYHDPIVLDLNSTHYH